MMGWEQSDCAALALDLIGTGLATADPYDHLTLNPALCPYLQARLGPEEAAALDARWVQAMGQYVDYLYQEQIRRTEIAAALTGLDLPNLLALLERVQQAGETAATIGLATRLCGLLQDLGRPRLLARVGQVRDTAARALGSGSGSGHARFEAESSRIKQQLAAGRLPEALAATESLLARARAANQVEADAVYPGAEYDLGVACFMLARVRLTAGASESALPLLVEAEQGFESIARDDPKRQGAAERMASACISVRGECLRRLGRLDASAATYTEVIARDERRGDARGVAVGKANLGTVRLDQRRYDDAQAAYAEARDRFARLDEPGTVAGFWHQTGIAYQESGRPEAAEDAYRESLKIEVRLGDRAGQAMTLAQLGNLYKNVLDRPEESAAFYRQAADLFGELGDPANEGLARSSLADTLGRLGRLAEARREVERAIECKAPFGHAAQPWTTWSNLAAIETADGHPEAAAAALTRARAAYLDYRRDGGENHSPAGRLALAVNEHLSAGDPAAARSLLRQTAADPAWSVDAGRAFIQSLDAIAAGSRDPALADTPGLHWEMSAEVLLLLDTLP